MQNIPLKPSGSYRDMNKLAERVVSVMNEAERQTLIRSHYENEAQTLTTGAKANLLKLKEMRGLLTEADQQRWEDIKAIYSDLKKVSQYVNFVNIDIRELSKIENLSVRSQNVCEQNN